MIADLKPYPAMKDSGVPWLGDVPEHWAVLRLKHAFRRIVGGSTPSSAEAKFWDGDVVWITPADVSKAERLKNSLRQITREGLRSCSSKLVPPGSLVVTSRAPVGNVAMAETDLCTNQGCKALVVADEVMNPVFGFHVLKTLKGELQSIATGTTFTEISTSSLGTIPMPLPPLSEQSTIARFLDHADRRIRRGIRAKQKLIALLNEQKQAIIHQAVTRGLDPNVRLKPSGVEWLGDVPEHWEVLPLKRAFVSMEYGISESATDDGTIRLLTMGNIKDGCVRVPETGGVAMVDTNLLLADGDLLFNRTNSAALVAKVGLFRGADVPVTFASYLVRLRPRRDCVPEYLNHVLNDFTILSVARREAIPSLHQSNLNPTRYGRLQISLPPVDEQRLITRHLNEATYSLERTVDRANHEISLLREYRTRLIADVVTGKLDVREAAARLPEEAEAPEPFDEADALEGGGDEATEADLDTAAEEAVA